ncbi:TAP-like protein-domain-containing protein [Chaetomium sp. MPI-CAGE-AT-0009]|nr:TAP-like protein-domain-containing protein [Chaetomium sp. MPI-CAGE-AT-0009]
MVIGGLPSNADRLSSVGVFMPTLFRGGGYYEHCDIEPQGLPVECAKLPDTLGLALIRYPAQNGSSQGAIMLNFGGPGQDGLNSIISYAPILGPWDPRGTGQTLRVACFEPEEIGVALAYELPDESPEVRQRRLSGTGDLVGMAFTARDMLQIVDALGEDGSISGGTTLGATAAAMFPDRVDKVILDGVMNAHEYYHSVGYETNIVISADNTFLGFINACFDNSKKCPLTAIADSPDAVLKAILDTFETLKTEPLFVPVENADPLSITYSIANSFTLSTLYRPNSYQLLAGSLTAVITKDTDALVEAFSGDGSPRAIQQQAQAVMGIRCGDKIPREDELSDLDKVDEEFRKTSNGPSFEAKERYLGGFRVRTSSPLLFIGNTYDPVTPLASARNMTAGFEGSVVLQQDGFGDTSIAQTSNCTNEAIARYFADRTLPEEGTVCVPNDPLFANDKEI